MEEKLSKKEQIAALQESLQTGSVATKKNHARTYLDESGNPTFYVKNISDPAVKITFGDKKSQGEKMPAMFPGELRDVLSYMNYEDANQYPTLRNCLSPKVQWLTRLTEDEYLEELAKIAKAEKAIAFEKNNMPEKNSESNNYKVPGKIRANTEKLLNHYKGDREYSMTPTEFVMWVENLNKLSVNDIDYMLSVISDSQVRYKLMNKKNQLS